MHLNQIRINIFRFNWEYAYRRIFLISNDLRTEFDQLKTWCILSVPAIQPKCMYFSYISGFLIVSIPERYSRNCYFQLFLLGIWYPHFWGRRFISDYQMITTTICNYAWWLHSLLLQICWLRRFGIFRGNESASTIWPTL